MRRPTRGKCNKFDLLARYSQNGFSRTTLNEIQREKNRLGWLSYQYREDIISGYITIIKKHVDAGWKPYLFTIMFNQIPGSKHAQMQQINKDIGQIYSRLVTRAVRKPASPRWAPFLPKGFFVPDLPVGKRNKDCLKDVKINDGLHFHGILVAENHGTRLDRPLDEHFVAENGTYVGATEAVKKIHVEPVGGNLPRVVDYAMKSLKRGRFTNDDIIVVPRVVSEVGTAKPLWW